MNLTTEEAVFYISKPLFRITQALYACLFQELLDFLFLFLCNPFFAVRIIVQVQVPIYNVFSNLFMK